MRTSSHRGASARRPQAGFSLIELLLASGLAVGMAAVVFGLCTQLLHVWNRNMRTLAEENAVQPALRRMQDDLASALVSRDDRAWLRVEAGTDGAFRLAWWRLREAPGKGEPGVELVEWRLEERDERGAPASQLSLFRHSHRAAAGHPLAEPLLEGSEEDAWWNSHYLDSIVRSDLEVWIDDGRGGEIGLFRSGMVDGDGVVSFPLRVEGRLVVEPTRLQWRLARASDPRERQAETESGIPFVAQLERAGGRL